MDFPAGLSARLIRRGIFSAFRSAPVPAIFHLPLAPRSCAAAPGDEVSDVEGRAAAACVQAAAQSRAPIVWLGGSELLSHPDIADIAFALVANGHYVFLHTKGEGLRWRLHEFQPVPRLYLTIEIPLQSCNSADSPVRPGPDAPTRTVAEFIRAARLSGFYVCGHLTTGAQSSPSQLASRIREFPERDLDGVAISSGGVASASELDTLSAATLDEYMRVIPSRGWRRFSRLLESSYYRPALSREFAVSPSRAENACEESA